MYVLLHVVYDDNGARYEEFVGVLQEDDPYGAPIKRLMTETNDIYCTDRKTSKALDGSETDHYLLLPIQEDGTVTPAPHPLQNIHDLLSEVDRHEIVISPEVTREWINILKEEINKDD
jgi:hypothetical protein